MKKNLAISLDSNLIKAAKQYAKANGGSLSQLVINYLLLITKKNDIDYPKELPPLSRFLKNILSKKAVDENYKKYLINKYDKK